MHPTDWTEASFLLAAVAAIPLGWIGALAVDRYSGARTSLPPSLMMALQAAAAVWALAAGPPDGLGLATLGLGWTLSVLACIDVAALRLPDPITLPLAAAGLVLSYWLPGRPWADHLAGAAAGYGALAALEWIYRKLRGRPGLGLGDAKLTAAAGAWLGWQALPSVLLIACAGGFLWAAVLGAFRRGRVGALPFGAPLCLGFWVVWLYGALAI